MKQMLKTAVAFALFLAFCIPASNIRAENRITNDFSLMMNSVTGDGAANSTVSDGTRYLDIFGFYGNSVANGIETSYNLGAKLTNDPLLDIKNFSITSMQFRRAGNGKTLTIGDVFESYSQYAMNSSLKGISYSFEKSNENGKQAINSFNALFGFAYPRWDCLTGDSEVKAIKRTALATYMRKDISPDLKAGLSLVNAADDASTRLTAADPIYNNTTITLDAEYFPFPGLTMRGEASMAASKETPFDGAAETSLSGTAMRVEATGDANPSRVTAEIEMVSPKYISLMGAAVADRMKLKTRWRYLYSEKVTMNAGLLWYKNNLENNLGFTTTNLKPDIMVTFDKPWGRKYATSDISYRMDSQDAGGVATLNHSVNLHHQDRFGKFDNDTNIGMNIYDTNNLVKTNETIINTAFSTRVTKGAVILKPSLNLGTWMSNNQLADTNSNITEYSVGLGADIPAQKLNISARIGQNSLANSAADDSDKTFVSLNAYHRPAFLSKLNNAMMYLRMNINSFGFTTTTRNYRETCIIAGLNVQL